MHPDTEHTSSNYLAVNAKHCGLSTAAHMLAFWLRHLRISIDWWSLAHPSGVSQIMLSQAAAMLSLWIYLLCDCAIASGGVIGTSQCFVSESRGCVVWSVEKEWKLVVWYTNEVTQWVTQLRERSKKKKTLFLIVFHCVYIYFTYKATLCAHSRWCMCVYIHTANRLNDDD